MKKSIVPLALLFFLQNTFGFNIYNSDSAQFLANSGIIVDHSENVALYRLDDTITRAELVAIALKKIGESNPPQNHKCKNYYNDVNEEQGWVCPAVEIAADRGLVTRENKNFNPQATVTRAEALAIFLKASNIKITECPLAMCGSNILMDNTAAWQKPVLITALFRGALMHENGNGIDYRVKSYSFRPDDAVTR